MNDLADIRHLVWDYLNNMSNASLSLIYQQSYLRDLLLSLVAIGFILAIAFLSQRPKMIHGIPEVKSPFLFGLVNELLPIGGRWDSHKNIQDMVEKYGPVLQFRLFNELIVLVNDPQLYKIAFDNIKGKGRLQRTTLMSPNIFTMNSDSEWKKRRQAFRHAFNPVSLRAFDAVLQNLVKTLCGRLDKAADGSRALQIDTLFSRFALDIIFNVGFELDCDFLNDDVAFQELNGAIQEFFKISGIANYPGAQQAVKWNIPLGKIQAYKQTLSIIEKYQRLVLNNLRKKYAQGDFKNPSFGKMLMDFAMANDLTNEEIMSELFLFMTAGHETTAHTLAWFVYSLCKYPDVQRSCHEAANASGIGQAKSPTSVIAGDQQKTLPDYVEATLKESMRKYPTVARGSMRVLVESDTFALPTGVLKSRKNHHTANYPYPDEVLIPKGAYIMVNFFALQNSKDIWGEDANEFHPERWLASSSFASPSAYIGVGMHPNEIAFSPFSYGIRNCLGMNMALWEIRGVLSGILGKYRFEFADSNLEDETKAIMTDFTTKPLNQLPVFVSCL